MMDFLAHIKKDLSGQSIAVQTVSQHCLNTAKYAAQALKPVHLSAAGYRGWFMMPENALPPSRIT